RVAVRIHDMLYPFLWCGVPDRPGHPLGSQGQPARSWARRWCPRGRGHGGRDEEAEARGPVRRTLAGNRQFLSSRLMDDPDARMNDTDLGPCCSGFEILRQSDEIWSLDGSDRVSDTGEIRDLLNLFSFHAPEAD